MKKLLVLITILIVILSCTTDFDSLARKLYNEDRYDSKGRLITQYNSLEFCNYSYQKSINGTELIGDKSEINSILFNSTCYKNSDFSSIPVEFPNVIKLDFRIGSGNLIKHSNVIKKVFIKESTEIISSKILTKLKGLRILHFSYPNQTEINEICKLNQLLFLHIPRSFTHTDEGIGFDSLPFYIGNMHLEVFSNISRNFDDNFYKKDAFFKKSGDYSFHELDCYTLIFPLSFPEVYDIENDKRYLFENNHIDYTSEFRRNYRTKHIRSKIDKEEFYSEIINDFQKEDSLYRNWNISILDSLILMPDLPSSFGNLPLKRLYLTALKSNKLPDCVSNLKKLEWLHLNGYNYNAGLENLKKLSALKSLVLQLSYSTGKLPDNVFDNMKNLERLGIIWEKLDELPSSIEKLENLKELYIINCYNLKHLPDLGKLKNLEKLVIVNPYLLEEMPKSIASLPNLIEYRVEYPASLKGEVPMPKLKKPIK